MKSAIILSKNYDPKTTTYSEPKIAKHGGSSVWIQPRTIIQTPLMEIPFKLGEYEDTERKETKYSVTLSFRGMDSNKKLKDLHDKLSELDNRLIKDGYKLPIWDQKSLISLKDSLR